MVTEPINIPIKSSGARKVSRDLKRIGTSAKTANKPLALMRNLLVVVAAARVTKRFLDLADTFVVMQNRLKLVTTGMTNLIEIQDKLFEVSQETGSSFESNVNLFARMSRATDRLGLSQTLLINVTRGINQALVLSGATAQEARNGLVQFSQGLASGTLRGDELRSVVEQFPELARIIGKEFGVAGGELAAFAKKNDGILKTDRIIKAIREALPDLEKRFRETNDTIGRGFERVNNAMVKFIGQLGQTTGLTKGLIGALNFLSENFEVIAKTAGIIGTVMLQVLGGKVIGKGVRFLSKSLANINRLLTVSIARWGLVRVASAAALGFVGVAIGGVVAALVFFQDQIITIKSEFLDSTATLRDAFTAIGDALSITMKAIFGDLDVWGITLDLIKGTANLLGKAFRFVLTGILSLILRVIAGFNAFFFTVRGVIDFFRPSKFLSDDPFESFRKAKEEFDKATGDATAGKDPAIVALEKARDQRRQIESEIADDEFTSLGKVNVAKKKTIELDKKFIKTLKSLRESLDPVFKANNELDEGLKILSKAFKQGDITSTQYDQAVNRLIDTTRDARLPILAFEEALKKELAQSKLGTEEREIVIAQEKAIAKLKEQKSGLTAEEITKAERLVRTTKLQIKANERITETLEAFRQPIVDFEKFEAIFARLVAKAPELTEELIKMRTEFEILALETSPLFADQMRATFLQIKLDAEITSKTMADFFGKAFKKMEDFIVEFVETGKFNLADLFNFIRKELIKLAVKKAIIGPLSNALAGAFQSGGGGFNEVGSIGDEPAGGGGGSLLSSLASSIFGSGFKFAHGGQFTVGGNGGTDSQLVPLQLTPGEQVTIMTPDQQAAFTKRAIDTRFQGLPNQAGTLGLNPGQQGLIDMFSVLFRGKGSGFLSGLFGDAAFSGGFGPNQEFKSFPDVLRDFFLKEQAKDAPRFAHGGSFRVGGSGGVDSQLVPFRATPGEQVTVGGSGQRPIEVTFNIQTPDADSFRQSAGQIGAEFSQIMSRHSRRNN